MDESLWGLMNILGPLILLVLLIWLVVRARRGAGTKGDTSSNQPATDTTAQTEQGTRDLYREEEIRHREGTDDAEPRG